MVSILSAAAVAAVLIAVTGCASSPPLPAPVPSPDPSLSVLVVPGVPRALAEHRAATIREVSYDLALDLTDSRWINGTVSIFLERSPDAGHLILDFRGLSVTQLYANQREVSDAPWVNEHIVVPERHLLEGENTIDIRFMSPIGAAGASMIRFEEASEGAGGEAEGETYHYSLLVPADASQLFPSFDQPDLKAVVRLEVIAPHGAEIVSNAPRDESVELDRGVWARFEPTAPISTYLLAVAAGPWESWSDSSGTVPMTLYARGSRAQEVDAEALLRTNQRAVEWLERYFDFDYPFPKFDFVLAPAFPFGGMEHPGAVFYNESRFIFREEPGLTERLARDATIYHEAAHQWFGNLVTMQWFDDLWLKEGFATYMAARMQEELNPGTGTWKTFYLQNKPDAYRVDATAGTTPVWQALPNLELAKSNYGPIVYNKAPSILKQLNHLVGEEAFRRGVQRLVRRHAFGNIEWRDLLATMQESSGVPLAAFGEQYILRAGVPLVETELVTEDGVVRSLRLVQRPAAEPANDSGEWWPGRVAVRLGYPGGRDTVLTVTFTGRSTVVAEASGLPVPAYVYPNDGDYGYGIFILDERSEQDLLERVGELEDPLLRTLVWGTLWDHVRNGRLPPTDFLRASLREIPAEADPQIVDFLLSRTTYALQRYLAGDDPRAADLRERFETALVEGLDDPAASYDLRKERLDALLSTARTSAGLGTLEELLRERRLFEGEPLPQPSRWVAVRTLLATGHPAADSILSAEGARDASPEGERQAFVAGAARRSPETKERYFDRYLEDQALNEEWVTASLGAFNHPLHREMTLPYLQRALQRLPWIRENRRIFFLPQWIESFVGGQVAPEALLVVDDFLATSADLPEDIRRKVLQARDELARSVRIRSDLTAIDSATSDR